MVGDIAYKGLCAQGVEKKMLTGNRKGCGWGMKRQQGGKTSGATRVQPLASHSKNVVKFMLYIEKAQIVGVNYGAAATEAEGKQ